MLNSYDQYKINKVLDEIKNVSNQKRKVIDFEKERKIRKFIKDNLIQKRKTEFDIIIENILKRRSSNDKSFK